MSAKNRRNNKRICCCTSICTTPTLGGATAVPTSIASGLDVSWTRLSRNYLVRVRVPEQPMFAVMACITSYLAGFLCSQDVYKRMTPILYVREPATALQARQKLAWYLTCSVKHKFFARFFTPCHSFSVPAYNGFSKLWIRYHIFVLVDITGTLSYFPPHHLAMKRLIRHSSFLPTPWRWLPRELRQKDGRIKAAILTISPAASSPIGNRTAPQTRSKAA